MKLTEEERFYLKMELGMRKANAGKWELSIINSILEKLRSDKNVRNS